MLINHHHHSKLDHDQHFSLQITVVKMSAAQPFKDRNFLAVIGDEVCPLLKLLILRIQSLDSSSLE